MDEPGEIANSSREKAKNMDEPGKIAISSREKAKNMDETREIAISSRKSAKIKDESGFQISLCIFVAEFIAVKELLLMDSDRITRIREMEGIYDRVQRDIATLREYEESGMWLQDYEADERGEIPRDLKRGVLSQDGLDAVFEEAKSISSPPRKYPVITLCGSTRFKEQFLEAQKRLTLEGNIVISVGLFGHSGDDEVWTEGTKEMLDDMHKRKIDMADGIFVINVGGYIGQSTRSEIDYALAHGKTVEYLERP